MCILLFINIYKFSYLFFNFDTALIQRYKTLEHNYKLVVSIDIKYNLIYTKSDICF